jgi:hypothetical protein
MSFFQSRPDRPETLPGPKKPLNFRCPEPALSFIRDLQKRGLSLTQALTDVVLFAKELSETLGEWHIYVEFEAKRRKVTLGTAVAQILIECLSEKYPDAKNTVRAPENSRKK